MPLVDNWLPPSRENWELTVRVFQFFPLITLIQWAHDFYPAGKTSIVSPFNIPGKIGWITMEAPGFITLLYIMFTLPGELGLKGALPLGNWLMASLFTIHYIYRSLIGPLLNPSMSPMHPIVWLGALSFQLANGLSLGGYLGGHGPTSAGAWDSLRMQAGTVLWAAGLLGNIWHDDELRSIRRGKGKQGVDKVYAIPQGGLFRYILYPHFLCEWIEWLGYWIIGGWACIPARTFLVNEITTMLPRAVAGRRWYIQRFGREKVGGKKAIFPGAI
ncbi:MAG: hypothetical protein M1829_002884 [Trizodia sp. TS-e1964]|nr:MAG: hypothetical protein M1829_002884 [Trizodia sp. TS-e1964]